MINIEKALELATVALKEKAERENPKPLTIEELRERVGKPVWHNERKNWALVMYVEDDSVSVVDRYTQCYRFFLESNTFYDHEPKEGAE